MKSIIAWIAATVALQILARRDAKYTKHFELSNACPKPEVLPHEIVLHGKDLGMEPKVIHAILLKRFPYYAQLHPRLQLLFVKRLQRFVDRKIFIIKDEEGVREMPVLVSASAMQLCFGLKSYLLPFYKYIRIFPEDFFRQGSLKILVGNVQDNVISVAWNHFLKGYEQYDNGSNVGLHEMSHALYIQKTVIEEGFAEQFSDQYARLVDECEAAADIEKAGLKDLYSSYADADLQEFWAESVELFFERPVELNKHYPEVFDSMKLLLNQDPLNLSNPLLQNNLSLSEKADQIKFLMLKRIGINAGSTFQ